MRKTASSEKEKGKKDALRFPTNISLILFFLRGSILYFTAGAVFACLVALFDLIIPRLIQYTVDAVIGGNLSAVPAWAAGIITRLGGADFLRRNLWLAAAAVAAAALAGALSRYAFKMSNEKGSETFLQRTRDQLFKHILSLPYSWLGENSTGDIIQRCTSDVETIRVFVSEQLTSLLHVFILVFMSLYFMISIQPRLTAVTAVFIPIMIISSLIFYGLIGEEFEKVDSEEGHLSAIAQENLTGVRVVRTFGREKFERERFEAQNEYYTNHWIRLMRVLAAFWVSGNVIATVRNLTVAVFGAVLCVRNELTAGGLIAFLSYNALMSLPVRRIGRVIADMSKTGVSMDRLRYIMNAVPEDADALVSAREAFGDPAGSAGTLTKAGRTGDTLPKAGRTGGTLPKADGAGERGSTALLEKKEDQRFAPMDRDIVFSHVTFRYGEDLPDVLRDVSMTIRAGSTVGILGGTGSGKSTLVLLLDRMWELAPEQGTISIGGVDIRDMDRGWLRQNIGMVLQEPYLFSRTLAENIVIAMPDASDEAAERSGRMEAIVKSAVHAAGESAGDENAAVQKDAGYKGSPYEDPAELAAELEAGRVMQEIRRASRIACLDEAVEHFADGYDTFVGERGVTLSGGQKQRAAIAQMLVRRTPIMIFDDSLSAVDAETDARIRHALHKNTADATVILIAHRITTLRNADEIFVLEKGRIAEHGSHDQLLAGGGIYSHVYALQTGEAD